MRFLHFLFFITIFISYDTFCHATTTKKHKTHTTGKHHHHHHHNKTTTDQPLFTTTTIPTVPNCNCSQPLERNFSEQDFNLDTDFTLYPTNSLDGTYCLNMSCAWKITIEYPDNVSYVQLYLIKPVKTDSYNFLLSECENNISLLNHSNCDLVCSGAPTQAKEICVFFTSEANDPCYENGSCVWKLKLGPRWLNNHDNLMGTNGFDIISSYNIIYELYAYYKLVTIETNGTLELWYWNTANGSSEFFLQSFIYIYTSKDLTNYWTTIGESNSSYSPTISKNGTLTAFIDMEQKFDNEITGLSQLWCRNKEAHAKNCLNTENMKFAYPKHTPLINNMTALESGDCIFSIVTSASSIIDVPLDKIFDSYAYVHILQINSLKYVGSDNVKVVIGHNDSYTLFEFSSEMTSYWTNTIVYGDLISFIIPKNGTLFVEYESLDEVDSTIQTFDNYGVGIIQSEYYSNIACSQHLEQTIQSQNQTGYVTFNLTIINAEISKWGSLSISNGEQIIKQFNDEHHISNQTMIFNGTNAYIRYDQGSECTRGLLIRYEARRFPFPITENEDQAFRKSLFWIILSSSLIVILVILVFLIILCCYCYKERKKRERLDFIIDILKNQKPLSPDEILELKEKRDEFTISKKRLKIYHEFPLGNGASSNVYIGFLYGQSPLTIVTGLLETRRFQDCKVAVKVPTSFGSDETEQLFREINSMKKIGYNEQVICMLGICFLDEKPMIAFELANKDLLGYVKTFRQTLDTPYSPFKIFFSILWQVASGMQFIASRRIVHRDLAARNILLTDSFNAKISDFGLSFCTDDKNEDSSSIPKKLPIKWLSIEALTRKIFSEKSDVWAFGVLMYEVFSFGEVPYKNVIFDKLIEFLRSGQRIGCPEAANRETYEIMLSCWEENPEDRPNFEKLEAKLHKILENATQAYGYLTYGNENGDENN